MSALGPSKELLVLVRAGFVQQNTSLAKWCAENSVSRQWATAVLIGSRNGPKASGLREKILNVATRRERQS